MSGRAPKLSWAAYARGVYLIIAGALIALWGARLTWYEFPPTGRRTDVLGFGHVTFPGTTTAVNGMDLSAAPAFALLVLIAGALALLLGAKVRSALIGLGALGCIGAAIFAIGVGASDAESAGNQIHGSATGTGPGRAIMLAGLALALIGCAAAAPRAMSARRVRMPERAPDYDDGTQ